MAETGPWFFLSCLRVRPHFYRQLRVNLYPVSLVWCLMDAPRMHNIFLFIIEMEGAMGFSGLGGTRE